MKTLNLTQTEKFIKTLSADSSIIEVLKNVIENADAEKQIEDLQVEGLKIRNENADAIIEKFTKDQGIIFSRLNSKSGYFFNYGMQQVGGMFSYDKFKPWEDIKISVVNFSNAEKYYSVVFHELAHATNIKLKRFERTVGKSFSKIQIENEEATAELTSLFLLNFFNLKNESIEKSAALYILKNINGSLPRLKKVFEDSLNAYNFILSGNYGGIPKEVKDYLTWKE